VSVSAPSRLTPPGRMTPFRAQRIWERNYLVYRRVWKVVITGFFEPVFYLFSIGIGIGSLVGEVTIAGGVTVDYTAFVAPALMAASAMNGTVLETTFNIFFRLKFDKVYDGILTTPMGPRDIAIGEIGWALLRGALYAVAFLVVMVIMGLTTNWWAILTIPGAVLIGFAFGSVGLAATTFMRSWQDFDLVSLVTMPLFLFSATFYPLDTYPPALQQLVRLSPLYQGNELLRAFSLGILDWSVAGHVAYLLVMGLIGARIASRRLDGLLRK
jgi:lipooligosaccharide transport system permease protein